MSGSLQRAQNYKLMDKVDICSSGRAERCGVYGSSFLGACAILKLFAVA
jgi:hypothetical protein